MKMGRKKKVINLSTTHNTNVDISQYDIVMMPMPNWPKLFHLFGGGLEESIEQFEITYGKIDNKVYYDEKRKLVGITGSNVIPHNKRVARKLNEANS